MSPDPNDPSASFRRPAEPARAEAIRCGYLRDVTPYAAAHGFLAPVALTAAAWSAICQPAPAAEFKLALTLRALWHAAQRSADADIAVPAALVGARGQICASIVAGDRGELTIIIHHPDQQ